MYATNVCLLAKDIMEDYQISKILKNFCERYKEMVCTLAEVFPECDHTAKEKENAENMCNAPEDVQDAFIRKWNAAMKQEWMGATFYKHVTARNGNIFNCNELFFTRSLALWPKWTDPDFVDDSKEALWMFIDQLNKHSRYYSMIPRKLFGTIQGLMDAALKFDENGDVAFSLETLDYVGLRDQVMSTIGGENALTEADLHDMTSNLGDVLTDVIGPNAENLAQMLQSVGLPNMDPALAMGMLGQATSLINGCGGDGADVGMVARMLQNIPPTALQQFAGALTPPK